MRQHHGVIFRSSQICVNLRMAGIMMAGKVDCLFIKCVRDGGIYLMLHSQVDDLSHILERSLTAHGGNLTAF